MIDLADRELLETAFRLVVATVAGMAIGLNRDLRNKPVGMRTLGLVSLGSALVILSATGYGSLHYGQDAASRIIQGILTGVGFLGAGVILHDRRGFKIYGLTTASTVWIAAALGVASGVGAWLVIVLGTALALGLLVLGGPLERALERLIKGGEASETDREDS